MDVFSILSLIGGLALFLYGMEVMSNSLKMLAGGKLEAVLARLTATKWRGFLLGFVVTAIIQSSSATTVMLVGFVNSGLMTLKQTISIIFGANIGTTVTAWLLSLTGINGSTVFLKLLKPESFTPLLALIGIIMVMFSKSDSKKNVGTMLLGFSVLMFGMEAMSDSVSGLSENDSFSKILTMFSNPIVGILVGTVFTAIIQSSSAAIGVLQALTLSCAIPHSIALPLLLGMNIGTTITPILSSISGNTEARRVAFTCLYIKTLAVISVALIFYLLYYTTGILDPFMNSNATVFTIAVSHTTFNLVSTVILMPFCSFIEKLALKTIRGSEAPQKANALDALDDRFLSVPTFAVEKCRELVCNMATFSKTALGLSSEILNSFDPKKFDEIIRLEKLVDKYEDKTSTYLVKITANNMSAKDSKVVTELLHCIGDIERISDHAVNIAEAAQEIHNKGISFSQHAKNDINLISSATLEILDMAVNALIAEDLDTAKNVEPLEQVIDRLKRKIKNNHISRLRQGDCTMELGFILSDLLTNYERVADHCSNIAVCLIEITHDSFETHKYLKSIKNHNDQTFDEMYEHYKEKYSI